MSAIGLQLPWLFQHFQLSPGRWNLVCLVALSCGKFKFLLRSYGVEQCYAMRQCVRPYARPSARMSVTKCHRKQTAGPRRVTFCSHTHVDKLCSSVSFQPDCQRPWPLWPRSDWNRVYSEERTWLSRTRWQIGQILQFPAYGKRHMVSEWHIYIWPSPILKVKVKFTHISTVNISQMATDRANSATANKLKVACDHSMGIFTFDIVQY